MPPLGQYFARLLIEPPKLICAPKGIGPSAADHFSCKTATSKGAAMGAVGADHGPPAAGGSSVRELGAEAMPPLWQYLLRSAEGRRVHRCPQRARTLRRLA